MFTRFASALAVPAIAGATLLGHHHATVPVSAVPAHQASAVAFATPTTSGVDEVRHIQRVVATTAFDKRQHHRLVVKRREERAQAAQAARAARAAASSSRVTPSTPVQASGCTAANWRSTMTSDEVWIDTHESTLNPLARNGQYWGLGQLGPSYAWTSDPCQQLADQRNYIADRYGSEGAAVAFWEANGWY